MTLVGTSVAAMILPTLTVTPDPPVRLAPVVCADRTVATGDRCRWLWRSSANRVPRSAGRAQRGRCQRQGRAAGMVADRGDAQPALLDHGRVDLLRRLRLWRLAGAHAADAEGAGLRRHAAAFVVSMFGVSIFARRIITGALVDRFWAPLVTLPILCLPAVSLLLAGDGLSFTMAVVAALLLGFSSGAETDPWPSRALLRHGELRPDLRLALHGVPASPRRSRRSPMAECATRPAATT